jgi:2-iminobutanoate/2-iminopropanoate deaminase
MMKVETYTPADVMKPIGPYSHIAKAGPFIAISAIAGVDPATGELAGPDVYTQTRRILKSFRTLLEGAGSGMNHVMHIHVFLKRMDDFEEMNRAYRKSFANTFQHEPSSASSMCRRRGRCSP